MVTKISAAVIAEGAITSDKIDSQSVTLAGPKISSINIANSTWHILDDTAVNVGGGYIVITGINFDVNATVTIDGTSATSVSVVDVNTIRAQVPSKASASYDVYVINGDDGRVAISPAGLTYSAFPAWSTAATLTEQTSEQAFSFSVSTDIASTFALAAGSSLPAGVSLSSNGYIYGTVTGVTTPTNYTFTVVATDSQNQDISREFTLPMLPPAGGGGEQLFTNYKYIEATCCWTTCVTNDYICGQCYVTSWTVPPGVTSISVLAVGGGGGGTNYPLQDSAGCCVAFTSGGGGLVWANAIPVTPGDVLQVGFSTTGQAGLFAYGGGATFGCGQTYAANHAGCATGSTAGGPSWICKNGCWHVCATGGFPPPINTAAGGGSGCVSGLCAGTYCINCGGNGYALYTTSRTIFSGAGAAGYTGNGGNSVWTNTVGTCCVGNPGTGGGGGSGGISPTCFDNNANYWGASGGGGGVGVWGCGSSGAGGDPACFGAGCCRGWPGYGGSGGTTGQVTCFCFGQPASDYGIFVETLNPNPCPSFGITKSGGVHGAAGGSHMRGGDGIVRIMWPGTTRQFPNTDAAEYCPNFIGKNPFQACLVQDTVGSFLIQTNKGIGVTYELAEGSSLPGTYQLLSNGYVYGTVTGLASDTMYCFGTIATDCRGCATTEEALCFCVWTESRGNCTYDPPQNYGSTTAAYCCYTFTVPAGVTCISAVAIGGGGAAQRSVSGHRSGSGGGLAWGSSLPVTAGAQVCVVVGSCGYASSCSTFTGPGGCSYVCLNGCWCIVGYGGCKGGVAGGTISTYGYSGTGTFGGGNGGCGISQSCNSSYYPLGGGTGGYTGNGGAGFWVNWSTCPTFYGNPGTGGGGRGGSFFNSSVSSGQGTSIIGCGCPNYGTCCYQFDGTNCYGYGGTNSSSGGGGGVRIIWGTGRAYPAGAENI